MVLKASIELDDATYQFLLDDMLTGESPNFTWTPPEESSSAAGPIRRTKRRPRARTIFTEEQLRSMEDRFLQSPYIARLERIHLSMRIGVSEEAVKTWFQNRRARRNRQAAKPPSCSVPQPVIPTPLPSSQNFVPCYNSSCSVWPNDSYHPYGVPQPPQIAPQPPIM